MKVVPNYNNSKRIHNFKWNYSQFSKDEEKNKNISINTQQSVAFKEYIFTCSLRKNYIRYLKFSAKFLLFLLNHMIDLSSVNNI